MTRIIAGTFRGRRIQVPKGRDIRPTTDRMRERLFSMLMHGPYPPLSGARVLDLFAGTGALGLEALSRGAMHVTFVEKAPASLTVIRENIQALGVEAMTEVRVADAGRLTAATHTSDIVFMDPPYREGLVVPALNSIAKGDWLREDGIVICELAADDVITLPECYRVVDDRTQGQQRILFLQRNT